VFLGEGAREREINGFLHERTNKKILSSGSLIVRTVKSRVYLPVLGGYIVGLVRIVGSNFDFE
jgi:hypothetical protein